MEVIHDSRRARLLGVSNVTVEQVDALCQKATVRPCFVQNRCFAVDGWDRSVREYCAANEIVYQGFSLLTANRQVLGHPEMVGIAARHGRTVSQIVFRFALDVGMAPLTGTSDADHMRIDLDVVDFRLDAGEVKTIEELVAGQSLD
jgi:diketogulonate reductase-like aldo/keto reductase